MVDEKKERLFDLRTVERNIENGLITREEYQAYLKELDDAAERAEKIEATFEVGVLDEEEEQESAEEEE